MVEEVYNRRYSSQKYLSPAEIRKMKKKALQSYEKIGTIKTKSQKELQKSADEAEAELHRFITSGSN